MLELKKSPEHTNDRCFLLALLALYAATAFLVVSIGAKQYHSIADSMTANYESSTVSSYLEEKMVVYMGCLRWDNCFTASYFCNWSRKSWLKAMAATWSDQFSAIRACKDYVELVSSCIYKQQGETDAHRKGTSGAISSCTSDCRHRRY